MLTADRGLLLGLSGMPARLLSSALHVLRPCPAKLDALPQGREVKHTASWGPEVFASVGSRKLKMMKEEMRAKQYIAQQREKRLKNRYIINNDEYRSLLMPDLPLQKLTQKRIRH